MQSQTFGATAFSLHVPRSDPENPELSPARRPPQWLGARGEAELPSVGVGRNDPVSSSGVAFFSENNLRINRCFNSVVWGMI